MPDGLTTCVRPGPSAGSVRPTSLQVLGYSGTFDAAYYLKTNPDLKNLGTAVLRHYHHCGWKEGRKPNPFFDPHWYLKQYPDVLGDPLLHYVIAGEKEGRQPIKWFDPAWYAQTYTIPEGMLALAHYLLNRHTQILQPIAEFDPAFYLKAYPDVAAAGIDPLEHYMIQGFREARQPFEAFDPVYYRKNYLRHEPDTNPLLHYLENRHKPSIHPAQPQNELTVFREVRRRSTPGPLFEKTQPLPESAIRRARVLAYYLPQYHATPENNAWWGDGFTEWTNTSRALPRFADHYQPRIPRDLGHYTLTSPDLLKRQADMAKAAGIEGFVFYFYWFNRKRLLDGPLEMLLANPDIDLPFCLMWANENWSRRWDGSDNDILIAQDYRPEDDHALIDCFARHMRDPRYIQVQGRPLLMVYRPGTIPDASQAFERWRKLFRTRHNLNPIFVMGQAFNAENPRDFGVDGAIEFPPHKVVANCSLINEHVQLMDEDFRGQIYDYSDIVENALKQPPTSYPLIRTAAPSWDNDARRQGQGLVLHGSTPKLYERWLTGLVDQAQKERFFGESIVCINAWNEWAEGAYLEPDVHFGSAYLNATARACTGFKSSLNKARLLLIGHDAFPAGAQRLLLEIGRTLRASFGVDIRFVLLEGGAMVDEYRRIAPVEILSVTSPETKKRLNVLKKEGFQQAILNSSASSPLASALFQNSIPYTFLIHELPNILNIRKLVSEMHKCCDLASSIIVPAQIVAQRLGLEKHPKLSILPQGLYQPPILSTSTRQAIRQKLKLPETQFLVLGAGYADMRKGFDLFLQLWRILQNDAHFVWLGGIDPTLEDGLRSELDLALTSGTFHMPGNVKNMSDWLSAADVFALTSREDPYPSVALEAVSAGLSCTAFKDSGGIPPFLESLNAADTQHSMVPLGDINAMAKALFALGQQSKKRPFLHRKKIARKMQNQLHFKSYAEALLHNAFPQLPTISVVVPSYNYARYLESRLVSIFTQTLPVLEIIVLDDASTDRSVDIAQNTAREWQREIRLMKGRKPSGSVFRQWEKAFKEAKGEWVWIAEADDLCDPQFLEKLFDALQQHPNAIMAFSDSRSIDTHGAPLTSSYRNYCSETAGSILDHDGYFQGRDFLKTCLSERNLILNVSGAVFKRAPMRAALRRCQQDLKILSIAGDWRIYLELLDQDETGIVYVKQSLNIHRRHENSATHLLDKNQHINEIKFMHKTIAQRINTSKEKIKNQKIYQRKIIEQFNI
ncbi:glycoside hydrolase family 99-like domain-containing protein [Gluconobacter japonicus]|uniref:glycoside hydrolase family 99-like domain-containing protein n=1 Tax=Gluconobacter japonicus TaxID=376620 RepID=UPI0024ACB297|nr:glycoside hydrolase family 99-like domain-containing protein [Gluconobacter japonicus]MDI6653613.1 glycoside hydrolase family 99-like domain-containing protein [Gluconobacter japonicus]